jgi:hypothetical protein
MPPQTGLPEFRQPTRHHRGESNSPGSVGPDARDLSLRLPSDEEFLSRFGDTIDDRIAEILDELLTERTTARRSRRLPFLLGAIGLVLVAVGACGLTALVR